MFGPEAFQSWLVIAFSALCFGFLFGLAVLMGEALFDGSVRMTRSVVGLGLGAALGYVGVAFLIRHEQERT